MANAASETVERNADEWALVVEALTLANSGLQEQLREAKALAARYEKSNRIYARENRKLWASHFRMSNTLEGIEKRRAAKRAKLAERAS